MTLCTSFTGGRKKSQFFLGRFQHHVSDAINFQISTNRLECADLKATGPTFCSFINPSCLRPILFGPTSLYATINSEEKPLFPIWICYPVAHFSNRLLYPDGNQALPVDHGIHFQQALRVCINIPISFSERFTIYSHSPLTSPDGKQKLKWPTFGHEKGREFRFSVPSV